MSLYDFSIAESALREISSSLTDSRKSSISDFDAAFLLQEHEYIKHIMAAKNTAMTIVRLPTPGKDISGNPHLPYQRFCGFGSGVFEIVDLASGIQNGTGSVYKQASHAV